MTDSVPHDETDAPDPEAILAEEAPEDDALAEDALVDDLDDVELVEEVVDEEAVAAQADDEDEAVADDESAAGTAAPAPARDLTAELMAEGDAAADYLEGLLDIADLDGDIDIDVENDRAAVAVVEVNAGELGHLVGQDGEVLSALQDLTRLAAARETGHRSRLMLDVAGHRATRKADLQRIAQAAIGEVGSTQAPVRLTAMSAFERKVVHDVVADAGLRSESEGVDPDRYVVISPA